MIITIMILLGLQGLNLLVWETEQHFVMLQKCILYFWYTEATSNQDAKFWVKWVLCLGST